MSPPVLQIAILSLAFISIGWTVSTRLPNEVYALLFLLALTRFALPGSNRELQDLLAPLLALLLIIRDQRKIFEALCQMPIFALRYLLFAAIAFIRDIEVPHLLTNAVDAPTGLRSRLLLSTCVQDVVVSAGFG